MVTAARLPPSTRVLAVPSLCPGARRLTWAAPSPTRTGWASGSLPATCPLTTTSAPGGLPVMSSSPIDAWTLASAVRISFS
jgi:hypothetical protein